MTATDKLRRLLDERGVEWGNVRNDGSESNFFTEWRFDGIDGRATATEWSAGNNLSMAIHRWGLTPEQAVEATLGRGTCKVDSFADVRFTEEDNQGHDYEYATLAECSECGAILLMPPPYIWYDENSLYAATNFCPNCGREVTAGAQDDG